MTDIKVKISQLPPNTGLNGLDLMPMVNVLSDLTSTGATQKYSRWQDFAYMLNALGVIMLAPCVASSTANLSAVYNNGTSGVGAILTASVNGVLALDGINPEAGDAVLVAFQTDPIENGIYIVTSAGSASTKYVLTRASYYNGSTPILQSGVTLILQGTQYGSVAFQQQTAAPITVGVTSIVFTPFELGVPIVGTTSRITVTHPNKTTQINIAANYEGQTSIVKLGAVVIGSWTATPIDGTYINYNTTNLKVTANQLNTIQDIATTSSTTFANVTATTKVTCSTLQKTLGAAAGYTLISDASGNANWTDLTTVVVTSATGTSNRITVSPTVGNVVIDIAATYVGQNSITTLGTIGTGVWQGTKVGVLYGGTNADLSATGGSGQYLKQVTTGAAITVGTIPASDIVSGAALTRTNDTNVTLTLGGSATTALLATASITAGWSGILSVARGGTNASSQVTNGVCYFDGTSITTNAQLVYTPANGRLAMTRTSEPGSLYFVDLGSGYTQWISSYGSLTTKNTFCNNVSIQEDYQVAAGSGSSASIILSSTSFTLGTTSNNDVRFTQTNVERLRATATGISIPGTNSLSIGTVAATPTFLGRIYTVDESATPGRWYFDQYRSSSGVYAGTTYRKARGTFASPTTLVNGDTIGGTEWYGYDGTGFIVAAAINAIVDSIVGTNDMPTALTFRTTADGAAVTAERARFSAAGNYFVGSNGFSCTSPTNAITLGEVNITGNELVRINGTAAGQSYISWYANTARAGYVGTGGTGTGLLINSDINSLILQTAGIPTYFTGQNLVGINGGLSVGAGYYSTLPPTNGVIIEGQVGVGTSSVASGIKLQIGSVSDTTANVARIANANSANANPVLSYFANGAQENTIGLIGGSLLFSVNPASYTTANLVSSAKLTMTSGGNFGVGVVPVAKLQVNASVGAPSSYANYGLLMYDGGTASASYGLGVNASTIWHNSPSYHTWYTNAVEVMKIYFGNLGINTPTPQARLSICGATANNETTEFGVTGGDNYLESINRNGGAGVDFRFAINDAHAWKWYTSNTLRMRLDAGLQVGLAPTGGDKGTGTINISADIYKNNTAYTNPDYAFEHYFTGAIVKFANNPGAKNYVGLKNLDDLKSHVSTTFRFPNISDEGTGVFERADIVLEKLEEAYLHIFELHDRIKFLESKIG